MMNRRGMLRAHTHWRPREPVTKNPEVLTETATVPEPVAIEALPVDEPIVEEELFAEDEPQLLEEPPRRPARWPVIAVVLAIAFGAYALGSQPSSTPPSTSTPRAWLHTYMSWSTRSPERVCTQLLTPTLAKLFAQAD